jgi:hypothetical protein
VEICAGVAGGKTARLAHLVAGAGSVLNQSTVENVENIL